MGSAAPRPAPGLISQFTWAVDDPYFGGLSALEISEDGTGITVLSDKGAHASGQIARDARGQIAAITLSPFALLKGLGQAPLAKGRNDSEGLAIGPDGTAYVSFEGAARVLRYARLDGPAENLPTPAAFGQFPRNSALEALAIDSTGRLYTLPERSGGLNRPFPIFRYQNGAWQQPLSLPRPDGFLPVAADFGPDGRLYILQRQFHGLAGFASRLIRLELAGDGPGDDQGEDLGPAEVLFQSAPGEFGNLEGVAIWRDAAGDLRASMVADNNYLPFLPSQIVEYRLPD